MFIMLSQVTCAHKQSKPFASTVESEFGFLKYREMVVNTASHITALDQSSINKSQLQKSLEPEIVVEI